MLLMLPMLLLQMLLEAVCVWDQDLFCEGDAGNGCLSLPSCASAEMSAAAFSLAAKPALVTDVTSAVGTACSA